MATRDTGTASLVCRHCGAKHQAEYRDYGLTLQRWKVDIWQLERSWALVNGYCAIRSAADLRFATFFDWDSILYDVNEQRVICTPDYFERIRRRVIDIQLEQNPNPLGNAVRAIRYAYRWNAKLGPRLAVHVLRQITRSGWDALVEVEKAAYPRRYLPHVDRDDTVQQLQLFEARGCFGDVEIVHAIRQDTLL